MTQDLRPVILDFLEKMEKSAVDKQSRAQFVYRKARRELQNHDQTITDPQELLKISYFGARIVKVLERKLRSEKIINSPAVAGAASSASTYSSPTASKTGKKSKTTKQSMKKKKKYVPAYRSGGYAILVALYKFDKRCCGLTKDILCDYASKYSEKSFSSQISTGQFYSAWNSYKILETKELLKVTSSYPKLYHLTEEGLELARVLAKKEGVDISDDGDDSNTSASASAPAVSDFAAANATPAKWNYSDFNIILVLDFREVRSKSERDFFMKKLTDLGVSVRVETLALGDMLWIAKHKITSREVLLNFIVERKRLDDLFSSISDGRFAEQKQRLTKTGLSHIHYLIEERSATDLSRFQDNLKTAVSIAIVGNGFHVLRSKDSDESCKFLNDLTKSIHAHYENRGGLIAVESVTVETHADFGNVLQHWRKNLQDQETCLPFGAFQGTMNKGSSMTVKELYIKMLMTIKGVSLDKAFVIQKYFSTPKKLVEAYKAVEAEKDKIKLLKEATAKEVGSRSLGIAVSRNVYESWGRVV